MCNNADGEAPIITWLVIATSTIVILVMVL